jgi:hypothetical protein
MSTEDIERETKGRAQMGVKEGFVRELCLFFSFVFICSFETKFYTVAWSDLKLVILPQSPK